MSKRKHAIEAFFQTGVGLHRSGQLGEAERIYRQVLAAAPGHADSQHMLGLLASQSGQLETALAWIDRAIAARPTAASGMAEVALRRHESATRIRPSPLQSGPQATAPAQG